MNPFKFDSGASLVEKIVTILASICLVGGLVFLFGSVWGIFQNDLARAAATGNAGDHTLGTILLIVALVWFVANAWEFIPFKVNDGLIGAVLAVFLALSIVAYCGFFAGVY